VVEKAEEGVRCGWRRLGLGARQEEMVEGQRRERGLVSDLAAIVSGCNAVFVASVECCCVS